MAATHPALQEQFDDLDQQRETSRLGLWLFLATEVLFFGGLFMAFAVYHLVYPAEFAFAGKHTNLLYGSLNTALLLTSGLVMSLAVHAIQKGNAKTCVRMLWLTILLGAGFLGVKGMEYADDIHQHLVPGGSFAFPSHPGAQIFFHLYWAMTGLHAIHLIVGIVLLAIIAFLTSRNRFSVEYHNPVELIGIYWGFVDLIWIFLYPLLYLIDRHP
ncbi:MAG TPA: cytochrome c oxidase subunit 3 [Candidatus Saccharimonadales bacterium]|nr:cytochrome c oxidase subunit 3 [Candidatus Saccharimonadales bacterium]